jgi:glycosyltransferase involved in cell wall biosynthesis
MFDLTIIIPFYNTIEYLPETLFSILNQKNVNHDAIQILLINDGSQHDLQPIQKQFNKLHIELHNKQNGN